MTPDIRVAAVILASALAVPATAQAVDLRAAVAHPFALLNDAETITGVLGNRTLPSEGQHLGVHDIPPAIDTLLSPQDPTPGRRPWRLGAGSSAMTGPLLGTLRASVERRQSDNRSITTEYMRGEGFWGDGPSMNVTSASYGVYLHDRLTIIHLRAGPSIVWGRDSVRDAQSSYVTPGLASEVNLLLRNSAWMDLGLGANLVLSDRITSVGLGAVLGIRFGGR